MNAQQQYHRELVLCALRRAGAPQKADAALLDATVALALGDGGAEPADIADLDCRKIAAALRGLEVKGAIVRTAMVRDARNGRDVPTYVADRHEPRAEPPKPPRQSQERLAVLGLRQGNALARKLCAKPDRKLDRQMEQMNELFREMASDQAGVLVRIEKEIAQFKAKYTQRYQALMGKAFEESAA